MDTFDSLMNNVFSSLDDDFRLLRQGYIGGTHPYSCYCLSCTFTKVLAPPDKDFFLTVEMAGTKKKDVKVTLKGDLLHIQYTTRLGELKSHSVTVGSKYYDLDKLESSYEDGLLTIRAPLKKAKPELPPEPPEKQIEIK